MAHCAQMKVVKVSDCQPNHHKTLYGGNLSILLSSAKQLRYGSWIPSLDLEIFDPFFDSFDKSSQQLNSVYSSCDFQDHCCCFFVDRLFDFVDFKVFIEEVSSHSCDLNAYTRYLDCFRKFGLGWANFAPNYNWSCLLTKDYGP